MIIFVLMSINVIITVPFEHEYNDYFLYYRRMNTMIIFKLMSMNSMIIFVLPSMYTYTDYLYIIEH